MEYFKLYVAEADNVGTDDMVEKLHDDDGDNDKIYYEKQPMNDMCLLWDQCTVYSQHQSPYPCALSTVDRVATMRTVNYIV